jgi:hypothetical protein
MPSAAAPPGSPAGARTLAPTADLAPKGRTFRPLFARWARRVRAQLALRKVLTLTTAGLVIGAFASGALWKMRHGALRPLGAVAGVLGAAAGLALARRRRWGDAHVALYLDERLSAGEVIATAVELDRARDESDAVRGVVLARAARALAEASGKQVRAPLFHPAHAALPVAAAAIAYVSLAPLPPAPVGSALPPGLTEVKLADVAGLEKVMKLEGLDARDEAQHERLRRLAEEAKRLRDKLREGAAMRDAQADVARLRDAITAERLSLGEGETRAGLEAALGKLGEDPKLKDAAKALGERDIVGFDDAMERLANKLEKADRERAQKTLEDAVEAARKAGAKDVARALEEEKKRLAAQGDKADKLREFAKELGSALGPEGQEALRDLGRTGSGKDAKRLADALEKGLEKLTDAQRKQLAENLKRKAAHAPEGGAAEGLSKEELQEFAERLGSKEGQQELEDELRRMATEPAPGSEEAERQKALDDAEEGAGEAERQLGGAPLPLPGAGKGSGKGSGKDTGEPQAGHDEGGGPGDHKGQTGVIEGGDMKSRANVKQLPGKPLPGVVMGRGAGRAGETANVAGEGALGAAAAGELGGIERSEVPEEYREQIGRYFQPK